MKAVKLSDLGEIITGKTPSTEISNFWNGDKLFLTPSDDMTSKYFTKTKRFVTEEAFKALPSYIIPKNSVCVSCIGSDLGKVIINKNACITNQQINTIIPNNQIIDTDYLYYQMLILGKELNRLSKTSTAVPIINKKMFSEFSINIHESLKDQKAIADVLSSFDDKIELNNKIIKNLEEQAQSLYKHWFIDFEFPDENGKPYKSSGGKFKQSELGLIPDNWSCAHIGDHCTRINTKVNENSFEVLSAINTGELIPSKEYFDKQVFSENIKKYICVDPHDFAYNPARANIGSIGMNKFNYTGCVSPVYIVVRFEKEYEWFWEYTIKSEKFKEHIRLRSSGSVRQNFDFNSFASIKIVYPSKKSVIDFNNQFLNINSKLEQLKIENQKLAETRDYLLPKLISGEVKVTDIK